MKVESISVTDAQRVQDSFSNVAARTGFGTPNLMESTFYPLVRITQQYPLLVSLYRNHWVIRRIIDAVAEDMTKAWVDLTCQLAPDELDAVQKTISKTKTQTKILEALKWGRLFGGGGAVLMIKGHEDILDQPLDINTVDLDAYRGLLAFERWSGIMPSTELILDIDNPAEFGLPAYYHVILEGGQILKIHSSRVIRFAGRDLPRWERMTEMGWGVSEVEIVYDELKKRDNTSWNIASLMFRANTMIMKHPNTEAMLSLGTQESQQALANTLQNSNFLLSNQGMMLSPVEGDVQNLTYSFGGVSDVYTNFMMDMCGAAEIPMSRLFGRMASALGSSNEGDEYIYFDSIHQKQNAHLRPALEKIYPVVCMSCLGYVPDDLDFQFRPIRTINESEQADLAAKTVASLVSLFNSGLISQKTALMELRNSSDVTGIGNSLTDEEIENADDDVVSKADMMPGGLGFGGKEEEPEPEEEKS